MRGGAAYTKEKKQIQRHFVTGNTKPAAEAAGFLYLK
jgi:hypothetical protein